MYICELRESMLLLGFKTSSDLISPKVIILSVSKFYNFCCCSYSLHYPSNDSLGFDSI